MLCFTCWRLVFVKVKVLKIIIILYFFFLINYYIVLCWLVLIWKAMYLIHVVDMDSDNNDMATG